MLSVMNNPDQPICCLLLAGWRIVKIMIGYYTKFLIMFTSIPFEIGAVGLERDVITPNTHGQG